MKRTFPANIDGQIFYIDEDAFNLLNNYLEQLRQSFRGPEGAEIVADIESRIRELFNVRIEAGAGVIVLADVNTVIETMGRPEDISETDNIDTEENSEEHKPFLSFNFPTRKKLFRNPDNKVFGGVVGGVAAYLGWNANIMRILLVVLAIATKIWPFVLVYLIVWMVIPLADSPRKKLEMSGETLNVENLGQAVMASSPTPPPYREEESAGSFVMKFFNVLGKCIMGFIGGISAIVSFACLVAFLVLCIGSIALAAFNSDAIFTGFNMMMPFAGIGWAFYCFLMSSTLLGMVLSGAFSWGAFSVIFPSKGKSHTIGWVTLILAIMLIIATTIFWILAFAA